MPSPIPGFEDGDVAPWSTNGVQAKTSEAHAHSGARSLAETGSPGTVYQDINGLEPWPNLHHVGLGLGFAGHVNHSARLSIYNPTDDTAVSSPGNSLRSRLAAAVALLYCRREGAVRIHLARGPGARHGLLGRRSHFQREGIAVNMSQAGSKEAAADSTTQSLSLGQEAVCCC